MNNRKKQIQKLHDGIPTFPYKYRYDAFVALAIFILDGLKTHKKYNTNSHPLEFDGPEEWRKIIDKMIWSFDQIVHDYPDSPHSIFFEKKWKVAKNKNVPLMTVDEENEVCFTDLLEEERPSKEVQKEYEDKVQEGLDLFATYFIDLWD